jgi:uncharacterized protein YcfL
MRVAILSILALLIFIGCTSKPKVNTQIQTSVEDRVRGAMLSPLDSKKE